MPKSLPDVLRRWIAQQLFTADELAEIAGVAVPTFYGYLEDRPMPWDRVLAVARHACLFKRRTEIAELLLTSEFEVRRRGSAAANGVIDDEVTDMVAALGRCVEAFRDDDPDAMSRILAEADQIIERLKAERDRL